MFDVDLEQLADAVAEMTRCEASLDRLLDQVSRQVRLLHETWSAEAAAAQEVAQRSWESGFRAMHDALTAMREAGDLAHRTYAEAADTNLRMWEQVS